MTNQYDGPRPGTPVTVIQAATPTRLTQAEAEELDELIRAALRTRFAFGDIGARYGVRSKAAKEAEEADDEAYRALIRWQLRHGLESK